MNGNLAGALSLLVSVAAYAFAAWSFRYYWSAKLEMLQLKKQLLELGLHVEQNHNTCLKALIWHKERIEELEAAKLEQKS